MSFLKKKFLLVSLIVFLLNETMQAQLPVAATDYRNFYGISWRGKPHENLAYARQMGYEYVFYQVGMELDSLSNGMGFYIETPEYITYNRLIDQRKKYSEKEKQFYENYCVLKDTLHAFPDNLATGWVWLNKKNNNVYPFTVLLDFQQEKVIAYTVDSIMNYVTGITARNPKFKFTGFAWDDPRPTGDFWDTAKSVLKQVNLSFWTNKNGGAHYNSTSVNYDTYTDGHLAFYKELYKAARKINANAHFISEPYHIIGDWIEPIENRADKKEITPDIISQESKGTDFVDDPKIYNSGLLRKGFFISSTPDVFDEESNRLIAAKAAINGSAFVWFGRFGGTGNMPDYKNISEVPDRLKLVRALTTWENLNGTALQQRKWDGAIYKSPTAFISSKAIYAIQPFTGKLFFIFLNANSEIELPEKIVISSVFKTNNLLVEEASASQDIILSPSNKIRLTNKGLANKVYIAHIKQ